MSCWFMKKVHIFFWSNYGNDLDHILVSIKYKLASSKHITCIPLLGMFDFTYFVILFMLVNK